MSRVRHVSGGRVSETIRAWSHLSPLVRKRRTSKNGPAEIRDVLAAHHHPALPRPCIQVLVLISEARDGRQRLRDRHEHRHQPGLREDRRR